MLLAMASSKAPTVKAYLDELPADRRAAIEAVRKVILANIDPQIREGMQYGMIGYAIPHEVFPAGYHCDPKQPLPYLGLASQKSGMSLYVMCLYINEAAAGVWGGPKGADAAGSERARFEEAWRKTGKKLDAGKACIRFKRPEDLALDVLAEMLRRNTAAKYIAAYQAVLAMRGKGAQGKTKAAKPATSAAASKTKVKAIPAAAKASVAMVSKVAKAGTRRTGTTRTGAKASAAKRAGGGGAAK
jgi:hypothetical protein